MISHKIVGIGLGKAGIDCNASKATWGFLSVASTVIC